MLAVFMKKYFERPAHVDDDDYHVIQYPIDIDIAWGLIAPVILSDF